MSSAAMPFRRTRTLIVAAAIVTLAAGAHLLGGGSLPNVGVLMGLAALIIVPVALLTARRFSIKAMVATLGSGQLVLHEAFIQLASTPTVDMAAHSHGMVGVDSKLMLAVHLLATVATAVVLAKNEAALFALIGWLRPLVRLPTALALPLTELVRLTPVSPSMPAPWRYLKIHPLRGPPLLRTVKA